MRLGLLTIGPVGRRRPEGLDRRKVRNELERDGPDKSHQQEVNQAFSGP
jgi:hypothetical protein